MTTPPPEPERDTRREDLATSMQLGKKFQQYRSSLFPPAKRTFPALSKATGISVGYLRQILAGYVLDPNSPLKDQDGRNVRAVKPSRGNIVTLARALNWDPRKALEIAGYQAKPEDLAYAPTPFPIDEWNEVPEYHQKFLIIMMRHFAHPNVPIAYLVNGAPKDDL